MKEAVVGLPHASRPPSALQGRVAGTWAPSHQVRWCVAGVWRLAGLSALWSDGLRPHRCAPLPPPPLCMLSRARTAAHGACRGQQTQLRAEGSSTTERCRTCAPRSYSSPPSWRQHACQVRRAGARLGGGASAARKATTKTPSSLARATTPPTTPASGQILWSVDASEASTSMFHGRTHWLHPQSSLLPPACSTHATAASAHRGGGGMRGGAAASRGENERERGQFKHCWWYYGGRWHSEPSHRRPRGGQVRCSCLGRGSARRAPRATNRP